MEAAEEEIQCTEENDFGNVGPAAFTEPQKRPTQAAGHGGPSFVQCFGGDQQRIDNCRSLWRQLRSKYSAWKKVHLEM